MLILVEKLSSSQRDDSPAEAEAQFGKTNDQMNLPKAM